MVARLHEWCLVVVGDTKTPDGYAKDLGPPGNTAIVYLSFKDQKRINNPFVQRLPFKSFSRKNVGYLYAIRRGAKVIYDFDDDNILQLPKGVSGSSVLS